MGLILIRASANWRKSRLSVTVFIEIGSHGNFFSFGSGLNFLFFFFFEKAYKRENLSLLGALVGWLHENEFVLQSLYVGRVNYR